ncbi:hypothetical protein SJI19_06790 [Acerihabitans sp. TG2]|uniref:hypothetical protein n=1 Tax=Acerihabitans sp. TG2 TaxID=3096008 RepID=UPI002B2365E8|nr:hypothetical protein [Acerihabitans sp. TG2]MEA9390258.1 hypothetical protein [Acerihabitans sp. TG2]
MDDPIPLHLIGSLTVDERLMTSSRFEPDADLLCGYSQTLARLLSQRTLSLEMEPILAGFSKKPKGELALSFQHYFRQPIKTEGLAAA